MSNARRVVLAISALPGLCARRTVVGDLSAAVANGPHPGTVSNLGPDRQPRLPGAHGNGTSLGPRALAFQIGARWALLEFSVARATAPSSAFLPKTAATPARRSSVSLAAANGSFNA